MRRRQALVAALGGLAAGCGYALVGKGVTTDPSIKRIGVPLFHNRTGRSDLDATVTQAVIEELQKRGRFTVVKEASGVDAVVEGDIVAYSTVPVNFTDEGGVSQATRYAITLTASVVYRKIGQKQPIWANNAFTLRDEYDMDTQATSYFDREQLSIGRLSQAFARNLVAAMLEAF